MKSLAEKYISMAADHGGGAHGGAGGAQGGGAHRALGGDQHGGAHAGSDHGGGGGDQRGGDHSGGSPNHRGASRVPGPDHRDAGGVSGASTDARVMAHVVPFYPDRAASLEAVHALCDAGVSYLEIQFPFSDPTADGPTIQDACSTALEQGFTVEDGFSFVDEVRSFTSVPVFLMCYASLVVTPGVEAFVRRAVAHGVTGLIVPDLPPDYDAGFYDACRQAGIAAVPVLVTTSTEARVRVALETEPEYVYVALRTGTTGSDTELLPETIAFLDRIRARGARIFAGFGIRRPDQVALVAPHCEAAVVGSAFVRTIAAAARGGAARAGADPAAAAGLNDGAEQAAAAPGSEGAAAATGARQAQGHEGAVYGAVYEFARTLVDTGDAR